MKTLSIYAVILFSIFSTPQIFAQKSVIKDTIKVWGNCGMCKKTIERSAKAAGATTANWSEETKQLNVSYTAAKTTNLKIQEAVAKAGYDTQDLTADDAAYNKLNSCCQYERKKDGASGFIDKAGTVAACCKDKNECKEMIACKDNDCCKM
ncbi:MAG: cation transporter [Ferruginibacter sp.]